MPNTSPPLAIVLADFMFGARIQNALMQLGWNAQIVGTPDAALQRLREGNPDVLLVELGAGNPARIEFVQLLRVDPAFADFPVLAFGSHKARGMLEDARNAGATLVVSNGLLVSKFVELLEQVRRSSLSEEERFQTEDD